MVAWPPHAFPATSAISADRDRIPAATAIRIDQGEGWLAWLAQGCGTAGLNHCILSVSSQAFKGCREPSVQESKQAWRLPVQHWLRIVKRGNKRQGEDNDLLETGPQRLRLPRAPLGGEPRTQPSLWLCKLEGTDCDQGQLLSLEFIHRFLSVVSQGKKRLWIVFTGPKERKRTSVYSWVPALL